MENISESAVKQVFEKLAEAFQTPVKNFDEYEKLIYSAASDFFNAIGGLRVEYGVELSVDVDFIEDIPENSVIFGSENQLDSVLMKFEYPIFGGKVNFNVYLSEKMSDMEANVLELVIRQCFFALEGLILELSCDELVMLDYKMGVPNITGFMAFAKKLFIQNKISDYTALYFNIHNFKSIYKELSYIEGDDALAEYCLLIKNAISKKEVFARLGGDNFVALILDDNIDYFLDLIQNVVMKYRKKDGEELIFTFGATIGAAKLDAKIEPGEILMQISSAYQHTRADKAVFEYYDPGISTELIERKNILSRFHKALANGEFYAVYQPKVDVKTRNLVGAEALVRWKTSDGHIMPNSFISILEEDGCVMALDFYMLEEVCKFLSRLTEEGIDPVKVSVNFSKLHLANNKLVEEIVEVIDRYGIPHEYIEVELTENEDFHNQGVMELVVEELSTTGIMTSMDDFGTGYSSLGMLNSLSIDVLKIDKSFIPINPIDTKDKSYLMFSGVVSLAKSLGLTIVVEGVETDEQLALVENMGCDIVQGYIFDKPLPEEEFVDRILQKTYVNE